MAIDIMNTALGISMIASMATMDGVNFAVILCADVAGERVFAATTAGVANLMNAASGAATADSTAANRAVEVVSAAETALEVKASAAVDPTAAARMVEDTVKLCPYLKFNREKSKRPAAQVAGRFLFGKTSAHEKIAQFASCKPRVTSHQSPQPPRLARDEECRYSAK